MTAAGAWLFERAATWIAKAAQARVPYGAGNPFLEGPFAPVAAEVTETDLPVTGALPRSLNGIYARIGPNPVSVANPAAHHWFLGDGMVHGVRLRDGKAVWYRNRYVATPGLSRRLGRPPPAGVMHRDLGTVNTNVVAHAGTIWALVEGGAHPVALDRELGTVRHGFFGTGLRMGFAAHPHRDPLTGALHAVCYDVTVHDSIRYLVVGADGALLRDVAVPVRHGPMVHDFALTATRAVIFDLPVTFSMAALLRGAPFPYQWNDRHPARVGLLARDGTEAEWFETEPAFAFHAANGFDLPDGRVAVDVVAYPRMFDGSVLGPERQRSRFERWVIGGGGVARTVWSDVRQEFPRMDERRTGAAYRYAYTVGIDVPVPGPEPLYRHDLETGAVLRRDFGPTRLPGEAVFVPRPGGSAEETDGWLMLLVHDLADGATFLTVLDAGDPGGAAAAEVRLPVRVPLGFHGNWIAD